MSISVKIATSEKELNDVYQLRYQVYVESEGYYPQIKENYIKDKFDAGNKVANIIAYDGDTPVGTMRANLDDDDLLPADHIVDFAEFRQSIIRHNEENNLAAPVFGASSMLAIAKPWRKNPIVFRELIRLSIEAGENWQVTHLLCAINAKFARMHYRLGWQPLAEKQWFEKASEYVVPMGAELESIRQWYDKAIG